MRTSGVAAALLLYQVMSHGTSALQLLIACKLLNFILWVVTNALCWCSGQIGFLLCTKSSNQAADPRTPKRKPSAKPIAGESRNWPELR